MKNSLKNACNAAMRNSLGHKPDKSVSNEPKGKFKFVLIAVVCVLVIGFAAAFALAR